jgi:hypothetical protein
MPLSPRDTCFLPPGRQTAEAQSPVMSLELRAISACALMSFHSSFDAAIKTRPLNGPGPHGNESQEIYLLVRRFAIRSVSRLAGAKNRPLVAEKRHAASMAIVGTPKDQHRPGIGRTS